MISLKVQDKNLYLKPDTRISFRLNNPLFNDDNLSPGSYTFPFDLAGAESSPANAATLQNPDVIENVEPFLKQQAEIFFDGIPFKTGKLKTKTITGQNINANFIFGLSAISDNIKTVKLRDIINEQIVIDNTSIPKVVYIKPGGIATTPYRIIVNGIEFEGDTLSDLASAINANEDGVRAVATYKTTGTTPRGISSPFIEIKPYTDPNDPLSPLHVQPAVDNGIPSTGYVWYAEAFDATAYNAGFETFLEGYFNGDYPDDKLRFPFCFNTDPYGEDVAIYNDNLLGGPSRLIAIGGTKSTNYVNAINGLSGILFNDANHVALTTPFSVKNINSLQPFLMLKWVLDKIAEYFEFEFEGDWYNDADVANALIDNATLLDVPMDFLGSKKFVFWRRSFNISELVPDISVVDFLKSLQNRYNLGVYVNELTGKVILCKKEQIAKAITYEDDTDQCSPIESIEDLSYTGIKLTAKIDTNDKKAVADEYIIGEPESELKTNISGLSENLSTPDVNSIAVTNVYGPSTDRKMSDKFEFRIFYYTGLRNAGAPFYDFDYPSASINATVYNEKFSGVNGLYEVFWKRWLDYQVNRKGISINRKMSFNTFSNLDWTIKRRFDRNNYLIKSLDFELSAKGISIVKAQYYSML